MSRSISLPDELFRKAEELAALERMSVEELVSAALSEQIAAAEYLRRRGQRASLERFRMALGQIRDAEPEPQDRL
jgi:hypothetical protein